MRVRSLVPSLNMWSPTHFLIIMSDSKNGDDINYEEALAELAALQTKLHKLRFELPNMLRTLAHIDARETAQQIFNKSVEGAKTFTTDLEDFITSYESAHDVLDLGKRKQSSGSNNEARSEIPSQNATVSKPPSESSSGSLAAQKSIQSIMQSGMSQEEPIILDEPGMSSFIQF